MIKQRLGSHTRIMFIYWLVQMWIYSLAASASTVCNRKCMLVKSHANIFGGGLIIMQLAVILAMHPVWWRVRII